MAKKRKGTSAKVLQGMIDQFVKIADRFNADEASFVHQELRRGLRAACMKQTAERVQERIPKDGIKLPDGSTATKSDWSFKAALESAGVVRSVAYRAMTAYQWAEAQGYVKAKTTQNKLLTQTLEFLPASENLPTSCGETHEISRKWKKDNRPERLRSLDVEQRAFQDGTDTAIRTIGRKIAAAIERVETGTTVRTSDANEATVKGTIHNGTLEALTALVQEIAREYAEVETPVSETDAEQLLKEMQQANAA